MAATGTYGFFNPITPISNSTSRSNDTLAPLLPPPLLLTPPSVSITPTTTSLPASSGHFFGSSISHFPSVTYSSVTGNSSSSNSGFLGFGSTKQSNNSLISNNNTSSSPLIAPLMSLGSVSFFN